MGNISSLFWCIEEDTGKTIAAGHK